MNDWLLKLKGYNHHPEYFFWCAVVLAFALFLQTGEVPTQDPKPLIAGVASSKKDGKVDPFAPLQMEAKSVAVYDVRGKKFLFEYEADIPRPIASITKIITAITALSLVPDATLITITPEALKQEGSAGLHEGEVWPLKDLLRLMLVQSSNDAAYAVSSSVGSAGVSVENLEFGRGFFIAHMNDQARKIGLTSTYFLNESGLDLTTTSPGGVSTARETAYLLAYAIKSHPSIFESTRLSELTLQDANGLSRVATNTNKDTEKVPLITASKTGYTDLAGGNLIIAFEAGFDYPIIISVLGSTLAGRFTDAEKLVWATLEYLSHNP